MKSTCSWKVVWLWMTWQSTQQSKKFTSITLFTILLVSVSNQFNFMFFFRRFNVALPSSASVERLFSQGGLIYTPKRTNLTDAHFEMLLFLKVNNSAFTTWWLIGIWDTFEQWTNDEFKLKKLETNTHALRRIWKPLNLMHFPFCSLHVFDHLHIGND